MVPVTYLFVFFLAKELEWTRSLSRLGTVAPDRRLSLREQHGRLSMCLCEWGRVRPRLPWMWASRRLASEARLELSQVVDRVGQIEAPSPLAAPFMYMYGLTGGSISGLLRKRASANSFTRASCYSWSSNGHTYYSLTKNQERTTLSSTTSDRQRAWVKRKNVCKSKAWRDGANLKAHNMCFQVRIYYCVTIIFAQNPGTWVLFRTPFSTTFRWRIFLKPTGMD